MLCRYFVKTKILYKAFENFDLTHQSNDNGYLFKKNQAKIPNQPPLGGLTDLTNDGTKIHFFIFNLENVVETLSLIPCNSVEMTFTVNFCCNTWKGCMILSKVQTLIYSYIINPGTLHTISYPV